MELTDMNFTDKDYEAALHLRRVTELAKPTLIYSDGTPFPSGSSAGSFDMRVQPPSVGGYRFGQTTFNLTKKPLWIHRMGVRLVLGWKWVDA
jgi:hypothetical protein